MSASHHAIVFVGKEGRLTTPFPSKKLPIYYIIYILLYETKRLLW